MRFFQHRIADKRVLRLIQKWLAAGVIEEGKWTASGEGVPQGASVSPLLANVYLHYVLDLWVHRWRQRHAQGEMIIVRFADDFVVGFERRDDAERFWADLREEACGVQPGVERREDAPDRVRAVRRREPKAQGLGKPETFRFLSFTHICGKTKKGRFKLTRITDSKRMRAKLQALKGELNARRHLPVPEQGRWLASVLRGHLNYYAVPDNSKALRRLLPTGAPILAHRAPAPQPAHHGHLEADVAPGCPMATNRPHPASLARTALRRHHPRQEPSALEAHAGIRAGGGPNQRAVPTATA